MSKLLVAVVLLTLVPATLAQRRTGQGAGSAAGQRGSQTGTRDQDRLRDRIHDQDRVRDRDVLRDQDRTRDRDRLRIHVTDQQRDQYRNSTRSANQARTQARALRQATQGTGFKASQTLQQQNRLREQVQVMQQEHARLIQGLSTDQRSAVQNRSQTMKEIGERVNTHLQAMDAELNNTNPNQTRLADHARQVESAIGQWQEQHQALASELSLMR